MAHTLREKIIAGLKDLGYREVQGRSRKYVTLHKTNDAGVVYKMFVGKSGACRTGDTTSKSFPISEQAKLQLVLRGEKILEAQS